MKAKIELPIRRSERSVLNEVYYDARIEMNPVDVKIKLEPNGKMPEKAHPTDAAFDIFSDLSDENGVIEDFIEIHPHETVKISAGFRTEIPEGYVGHGYARSGLSTKEGLRPANCVMTIDAPYRGIWIVPVHNDTDVTGYIKHGERIAQMTIDPVIPVNLIEVEKLGESDRGETGFGDSGKF